MRIFLTGATGFVGSAVLTELLAAGHEVLGLARSESAARQLMSAGAAVHRGDLTDSDSLRSGVAGTDAVIHTGFIHDFTRFREMCEIDRTVIETIGAALAGTDRPFLLTSALGLLPAGRLVTEADQPAASGTNPRIASEQAADKLAAQGVRVAVVRLPPSVHGRGDHGFVPILMDIARKQGRAVYSEQLNAWAAVHRLDAARLYRLAVETPVAPGTRYHAVAEEGVPFRDIITTIGRRLQVPVDALPADAAAAYFGWFAHFAAMDVHASGAYTREGLGWQPAQKGLLEDIDSDSYFPGGAA